MKTLTTVSTWVLGCLAASAAAACSSDASGGGGMEGIRSTIAALSRDVPYVQTAVNTGSRMLALSNDMRFDPIQPGADPDNGRAKFGVAPDLVTEDSTDALFEGFSGAAMKVVESNGRSCFSCHRGADVGFGLPVPPLSDTIAADDPIFTGIEADAQGDPDAAVNLDQLGLIKYRPNRFNPQLPQSDGLRQVFFWRKSPRLTNVAFNHGFLMDGRGRVMFETARGAVFSHTQPDDDRFDDLFSVADANDMEAFMFSIVSDPALLALRDPNHPDYETLKNDPFATVDIQTQAQERGSQVFSSQCMSCHNTPNVFNNISSVEPLGSGRPVTDPTFGPGVGRMFNIGVSERNAHGLRFTHWNGSSYEPVVVELAKENSPPVFHEVTIDIGLAASTGREEDIGRFKVPQLRGVADAAPYFHDNSASTLEEAVDYHTSSFYKSSRDGMAHPITLSPTQRADLLEFLEIL